MKFANEFNPIEYCASCRTAANMNVTVTPRVIAGKNGKVKTIIATTYHCESCGSFVRSIDEDEETPAAIVSKLWNYPALAPLSRNGGISFMIVPTTRDAV